MPNPFKNKVEVGYEEYFRTPQPGFKKILIEQSTIVSILAIIIFKAFSFFFPDDVSLVYSMPELLLSLTDSQAYPILLGLLLSFMTWHVMYLDSAVPGVNPPTPLSPSKYREASGADFHINYVFAMTVGPMIAIFLYAGWV